MVALMLAVSGSDFDTPIDNLVVNLPFNLTIAWNEDETAIVIEWDGAPLGEYEIIYTGDLSTWKAPGSGSIVAGASGGRLQWIDNGPPETESAPASVSQRFYQIQGVK